MKQVCKKHGEWEQTGMAFTCPDCKYRDEVIVNVIIGLIIFSIIAGGFAVRWMIYKDVRCLFGECRIVK